MKRTGFFLTIAALMSAVVVSPAKARDEEPFRRTIDPLRANSAQYLCTPPNADPINRGHSAHVDMNHAHFFASAVCNRMDGSCRIYVRAESDVYDQVCGTARAEVRNAQGVVLAQGDTTNVCVGARGSVYNFNEAVPGAFSVDPQALALPGTYVTVSASGKVGGGQVLGFTRIPLSVAAKVVATAADAYWNRK